MQAHPLIPKSQTYVLDRKLISFHSYDRDIKKWPEANHFEIMLPQTLLNVQSMRLDTISLPSNQFIFSEEYQNTKMSFSMEPYSSTQNVLDIEIDEGAYCPKELAREIQTKMNSAQAKDSGAAYNCFVCKYNCIDNTLWFGNVCDSFSLVFDKQHPYKSCNNPPQEVLFNKYTKWGLPAYLGYKKAIYESTKTPERYAPEGFIPLGGPYGFSYEYKNSGSYNYWLNGTTPNNYFVNVKDPKAPHFITDPAKIAEWKEKNKICNINILGEDIIYMEVDKYNSMDELEPYSENTSGLYNNDYNGKVNSAFAKIPLPCPAFSQQFDSRNSALMNVSHYEPPLERLTRLKFKFRYHDGRLVKFKCLPLSFTIEFNMLRDEQMRARNVRIPGLYRL
tara:strand:+ start:2263 stop:3435 length:1173 start_codon:yes stop_codon:yes gene_type:complete